METYKGNMPVEYSKTISERPVRHAVALEGHGHSDEGRDRGHDDTAPFHAAGTSERVGLPWEHIYTISELERFEAAWESSLKARGVDPYIITTSGKHIHFMHPEPEDIMLEDIAVGLSKAQRFCGHLTQEYSVAAHSLNVEALCTEYKAEALFHDAAEAYTGDITAPLKYCLGPVVEVIQHKLNIAIAERFKLTYPWPAEVIDADDSMLFTEAYFLGNWAFHHWLTEDQMQLAVITHGRLWGALDKEDDWKFEGNWLKRTKELLEKRGSL